MSKQLSWSTIQNRLLDAYLFQMPTNAPISFQGDELVGDAQNFVIILLDGPIVGGQDIGGQTGRWGLAPTKSKQLVGKDQSPTNLPTNMSGGS